MFNREGLNIPPINFNAMAHRIYNYKGQKVYLQTNSYANPQGYYEVVIACNDYLNNMREYKSRPNVNTDAWEALVASALRVKVWTYKTLAEIYGMWSPVRR